MNQSFGCTTNKLIYRVVLNIINIVNNPFAFSGSVLERTGARLGGQHERSDWINDRCRKRSHTIHALQCRLHGRSSALRYGCKRDDRYGMASRIGEIH